MWSTSPCKRYLAVKIGRQNDGVTLGFECFIGWSKREPLIFTDAFESCLCGQIDLSFVWKEQLWAENWTDREIMVFLLLLFGMFFLFICFCSILFWSSTLSFAECPSSEILCIKQSLMVKFLPDEVNLWLLLFKRITKELLRDSCFYYLCFCARGSMWVIWTYSANWKSHLHLIEQDWMLSFELEYCLYLKKDNFISSTLSTYCIQCNCLYT